MEAFIMTRKPRIFVASSEERLDWARAVEKNLSDIADITLWKHAFSASEYTLEILLEKCGDFDFAVFIFYPDDMVKLRGKEFLSVRDNVLLEYGIFVKCLGRKKCFIVLPNCIEEMRVPSDLSGLTLIKFDTSKTANLNSALSPACTEIRDAMKKIGLSAVKTSDNSHEEKGEEISSEMGEIDCRNIIDGYLEGYKYDIPGKVIRFAALDKILHLPNGASERYLEEQAIRFGFEVHNRGEKTIMFDRGTAVY